MPQTSTALRKLYREGGSFSFLALDGDTAAMELDNFCSQMQAFGASTTIKSTEVDVRELKDW